MWVAIPESRCKKLRAPFLRGKSPAKATYFRDYLALFDDSALGALNRQSDFRVRESGGLSPPPAADDPSIF